MVAVAASEAEVLPHLDGLEAEVSVAAVNGPSSVVLSGVEDAVLRVAGRFAKTRRLKVSHAFHSPLMSPMLDKFAAVVRRLEFRAPQIAIASTVGAGADLSAPEYWVRHVAAPVRFAEAVGSTRADAFLELGADGVASAMIGSAAAVPLLRGDGNEMSQALEAAARVHVLGVRLDWAQVLRETGGRSIPLLRMRSSPSGTGPRGV